MHTEHKKRPCFAPESLITQNLQLAQKITQNLQLAQKITQNLQEHNFINNSSYVDKKKDIKENNMNCEYCDKNFKRKYNLSRHLKICRVKNDINRKLEIEIEILKNKKEEIEKKEKIKNDEIENLKNENNILKHDVEKLNNNLINANPIININNSINNNNNNIQINIVNYGEEDLSKLDLTKILKYDNSFIEMVFRDIHCNREFPEYQNILLPSLSRYEIYVKLNNEWLKRNKKEILKERYLIIRDYIMELYTEESEKNKKKAEEIYYHFLKQIKLVDPTNTIYKPEEEKKIINGIENVLYNHKNNIKSIDKSPIILNKKNKIILQ